MYFYTVIFLLQGAGISTSAGSKLSIDLRLPIYIIIISILFSLILFSLFQFQTSVVE